MKRIDRRILLVAVLYGIGGLGIAWLLADTTVVGADLNTYQRAAHDLYVYGDPYRSAPLAGEDFRYRYPPLLAMLSPLLSAPAVWYALLGLCTAFPIWLAVRRSGWLGALPALLLFGAWGQQLLNGNAQAIVIALMALVPLSARAGAVGLGVATMLKLHPALGAGWYVARGEWRSLMWYLATIALLLVIQAPWLGAFVDYYLHDPTATSTIPGMSLRAFGVPVWLIGIVAFGYLAYRSAGGRWGWFVNVVWQMVALPRILLVNLALLLAAPLPRPADRYREADRDRLHSEAPAQPPLSEEARPR
jgi:hypothetical protein